MKAVGLALLLLASSALADGPAGQANSRVSRGNFLRIPVYRTPGTAAQNYYVDPTGNDSNTCTGSGTSACLTIQGAVNKIPKLLRDEVIVNIAAGTYAGFIFSGFTVDNGIQQATGGVLINGALVTSTLATGSATGTATSGTAGSTSTFGTLTDSGATWTVNDLRGRFITTATPTNATFVISSNTATTITVEGTWSSPTGSTTYTIQDPSVIINTNSTQPASPVAASNANRASVQFLGNTINYRSTAILMQNIRIANSLGGALEVTDSSTYRFLAMQFRPTSVTANALLIGAAAPASAPLISLSKVDISVLHNSGAGSGINMVGGQIGVANSMIRTSGGTTSAFLAGGLFGGIPIGFTFTTSEILNFNSNSGQLDLIFGVAQGGNISNSHITCGSSFGTAIGIGSQTSNIAGAPAVMTPITAMVISTCGTALMVVGPADADVTSMTGSTATSGFAVSSGGLVTFGLSGTTFTPGSTAINLDSSAVTATAFSDVTAGHCISTLDQGSRVCAR